MENYKEKYKQALERARIWKEKSGMPIERQGILDDIFPELKESEDEKIRKSLIKSYINQHPANFPTVDGFTIEQILAWLEKQGEKTDIIENFDTEFEKQVSRLIASAINKEHEYNQGYIKWAANALLNYAKHELEKQGEQKPTDKCIGCNNVKGCITCTDGDQYTHITEQSSTEKVEPKFKADDWITNSIETVQITGYDIDYGYQVDYEGNLQHRDTDIIEKEYHLWTIQDARDGDVLATKDIVFIFKHMNKTGLSLCKSYCEVIGNSKLGLGFDFSINDIYPATKEQRDLLFQKMKEAGYEWDAEKKELKKIEESNPAENTCKISDCAEKVDMTEYNNGYECGKQRLLKYPEEYGLCKKYAWSEEDENLYNRCMSAIQNRYNDGLFTTNEYRQTSLWLKSIKERLKGE